MNIVKNLSLVVLLCGVLNSSFAQPVITSSTNSPLIGDVFYGFSCDTNGVTAGSGGAGIVWDFSTLSPTIFDTVNFIACDSTPFCDSFVGSNIASGSFANGYTYFKSDTNALSNLGEFLVGSGFFKWDNPFDVLYYPISYNSQFIDTANNNSSGVFIVDSFICDGHGTLILPTGTYSNVLRLHKINIVHYSSSFQDRTENYIWLQQGFRHELLWLNYDTSGGSRYLSSVYYYSNSPLSIINKNKNIGEFNVYPNPANEKLEVDFKNRKLISYRISNTVGITIQEEKNVSLPLSIDIKNLQSGLYYIKIFDDAVMQVKTFIKL